MTFRFGALVPSEENAAGSLHIRFRERLFFSRALHATRFYLLDGRVIAAVADVRPINESLSEYN